MYEYPDEITCNFCGKRQEEVLKLLSGHDAFICNECVDLASDVIEQNSFGGKTKLSHREEAHLRMQDETVGKAWNRYLVTVKMISGKNSCHGEGIDDSVEED